MKTIVLLHGALGNSDDLNPLAAELNKHQLQTHSFEFSGHRFGNFKSVFNIPLFAEELTDFISKNNLKNSPIFGYSMGGYVALYRALQQTSTQTIITLGTKFDWSNESTYKETKMLQPEKMKEKIPGFVKLMEAKHGMHWEHLVTKTAALMHDINQNNYLNDSALSSLKAKVRLGLADSDQMVSYHETSHVFRQISGASLFMLPASKHPIEMTNLPLLAANIVNFIEG